MTTLNIEETHVTAKANIAACFNRRSACPGRNRGSSLRFLGALTFTLLALLTLGAGPAFGLVVHRLSGTIGSSGSGDGQLSEPAGIAVNLTSHNVYVVDSANARVVEFSSTGSFIRAFGADVGGPGVDVCTSGCVGGTPGGEPGQFFNPAFIAVDNSGGPSEGDVYVADPVTNLVQKFTSTGDLITSWASGGQLDGSNATDGPFHGPAGVAVEDSGNLLVATNGVGVKSYIFRFAQDGNFITDFAQHTDGGLAVDAAKHIFVRGGYGGAVEELQSDGTDLGQISEPFRSSGFGVDSDNGDVYNDRVEDYVNSSGRGTAIQRYSIPPCSPTPATACTPVETFGSGDLTGATALAVDPSLDPAGATVYAVDTLGERVQVFSPVVLPDVATGQASSVTPTSATLEGTVNPAGLAVTDCHFEYVTDTAFRADGFKDLSSGGSAPCESPDAAEIGSGTGDVLVHAEVGGLSATEGYHFRLVAANANDSNSGSAAALLPPSVDSAAAQNITATEAELLAEVNPNGFETSCTLEWGVDTPPYGTGGSYEHEEACKPLGNLGSGNADINIDQHISGLSADTTYHWRVIATNAKGTTTGADHTFLYDTTSEGLPDGRAYEMVTPDYKDGQPVRPVLVSSDGDRFIAESGGLFAGGQNLPDCANNLGAYYEFHRTATGWQTTPMSPPAADVPQACMLDVGSPDLTETLWENTASPNYQFDLSIRHADGSFTPIGPSTPVAGWRMQPVALPEGVSDDLSHVVWSEGNGSTHDLTNPANDIYTEPYFPFDPTVHGVSPLEYVGTGNAAPSLVSVTGGSGSTAVLSKCGSTTGGPNSLFHAMSSDGQIVFFTPKPLDAADASCSSSEQPPVFSLFARIDNSQTVAISEPSKAGCAASCQASSPSDANFEGASASGTKVFFTSTQQLLDSASEDSTDSAVPQAHESTGCAGATAPGGCNLYLYDFNLPEGERLIDVSGGSSDPRVQGVTRISDDGSHAYFVAKGILTTAANAQGQNAVDGADNLYVFERDSRYPAGHTAFIADLCSSAGKSGDLPDAACPAQDAESAYGALSFQLGGDVPAQHNDRSLWTARDYRPAETTPDGRYLVFESRGQLTPDTTGSAFQVFVYDAQTGSLTRVSHGERGFNDNGNGPAGGAADAFIVAPLFEHHVVLGINTQAPNWRAISDDGSDIFFQSPRALTPKALNDVPLGSDHNDSSRPVVYAQNVYEFHEGRVSLISDGRDTSRAAAAGSFAKTTNTASATSLVGTNASGTDVFFSSADQLTPGDTNSLQDIYDARVNGGFPETHPIPCQTGESCHGGGTTEGSNPSPATPGFNGKEEGPNHPFKPRKHKHRKHRHRTRHHKSKRHHQPTSHNHRRAG
jgi:hypothetical protein